MRAILIVSTAGPVVFHTSMCSRDFVDNVVRLVESDYHAQIAFAVGFDGSTGKSGLGGPDGGRKASAFQGRNPMDGATSRRAFGSGIVEGLIALFPEDHPWLGSTASEITLLWRKIDDRVIVFALETKDNLALARSSMATLVTLLSDAFRCRGELPPLKDLQQKPELVQSVCDIIAPQNHLVLLDAAFARQAVMKLASK